MHAAIAVCRKRIHHLDPPVRPRPADRSASYGPCGQPVDKLALAHRLTTLAGLADHRSTASTAAGMMLRMKRSAAASSLPTFGHHPGKSNSRSM